MLKENNTKELFQTTYIPARVMKFFMKFLILEQAIISALLQIFSTIKSVFPK